MTSSKPRATNLRSASLRAAAFVLSIMLAGIALVWLKFSQLGSAVVATLALFGICRGSAVVLPFADERPLAETWQPLILEALTVFIGLWVVAALQPGVRTFVCETGVPHNIAIAIFGAFSLAWLSKASMSRSPGVATSFFIMAAFSWIAPFYAFFSGPWEIAQAIAVQCPGSVLHMELLGGPSMIVAAIAGRRTAQWMFTGVR